MGRWGAGLVAVTKAGDDRPLRCRKRMTCAPLPRAAVSQFHSEYPVFGSRFVAVQAGDGRAVRTGVGDIEHVTSEQANGRTNERAGQDDEPAKRRNESERRPGPFFETVPSGVNVACWCRLSDWGPGTVGVLRAACCSGLSPQRTNGWAGQAIQAILLQKGENKKPSGLGRERRGAAVGHGEN